MSSPKEVVDFLTVKLSGERVEKFLALFLSSKNEVLAIETINEGTINQTAVYPRKVIEHAHSPQRALHHIRTQPPER